MGGARERINAALRADSSDCSGRVACATIIRSLADRRADIYAVAFLWPTFRRLPRPSSVVPMKKTPTKPDDSATTVRCSSRVYFQVRAQAVIYPVFPTQKPKRASVLTCDLSSSGVKIR